MNAKDQRVERSVNVLRPIAPSRFERRWRDSRGVVRAVERTWLLATLACVIAAQLLYAIHFYKPHFQSDDAVLNMLAESMWNHGSLFPLGWTTNNGDLMVPSGALLVAPLLSWIPNGYHAHSVVGLFAIAAMLLAFTWFVRQRIKDISVVTVAAAACISGLSWYCAHAIYQQTTYLWWPGGFFVGATLVWKWWQQRDAGRRALGLGVALFVLVFTICFANPARTAIMFLLPLYAFDRALAGWRSEESSVVERWSSRIGLSARSTTRILIVAFVSAAFGYACLVHTGRMETFHGASGLHWAGWSAVAKHLGLFVEGWFPLLGVSTAGVNMKAGMFSAALELGRLVLAVWLTWVAISEISTLHRQQDKFRRALGFAFVAAFVPILLLYVFLAPLAVDVSTMRYFIVPLFILLALAAVRIADSPSSRSLAFSLVLVAVGTLLAFTSVQRFVFYANQPLQDFWRINPSATMQLAETLKREKLEWGYATWWNAGVTTVMSDGLVRVNPVTLSKGEIRPFPFMVQKDWYIPASWRGETFLALDANDRSKENLDGLRTLLGPPSRIVDAPFHTVFVYDHNIIGGCERGSPMSSPLGPSRARIEIVSVAPEIDAGGKLGKVLVVLRNDTGGGISGIGAYPISIGMRLLDGTGAVRDPDWLHLPLGCAMESAEQRSYIVTLPEVPEGEWTVQIDVVQEGVAWFHQWGRPMSSFGVSSKAGSVSSRDQP